MFLFTFKGGTTMDYDDFFLDNDELDEQNSIGAVDEAKLEILGQIEQVVKDAKLNIKYKEEAEFRANFSILSRYVGAVVELEQLISPMNFEGIIDEEAEELSENDILERIDEIMLTAKELSFNDLREFEEKSKSVEVNPSDDDDTDLGF